MKKFAFMFLAIIIVAASVLPTSVAASPWQIIPNDRITVPFATPEIDGNINTDEGWSEMAYMHEDQTGYFWEQPVFTDEIDLYFAYDEWGLYYAASITEQHNAYTSYVYDDEGNCMYEKIYVDNDCADYTEEQAAEWLPANEKLGRKFLGNTFEYSTGEDDIDTKNGENIYGWNGDVFGFMIDPASKFVNNGYWGDFDYTAWYCIGIFEDDSLRMWRSRVNNGEITDQVKLAGRTNGNGWILEAGIPWDIIVKDANDMAAGNLTFTKEEIIESAFSRAATMYLERFYDFEAEMVDTWGRYIVVNKYSPSDGELGHLSEGECLDAYGLELACAPAEADDTTAAAEDTTTAAAGDDTTKSDDTTKASDTTKTAASTTKKPASTTKAASTGTTSTGTSSTQTFDAGIAVAAGALAISAIGCAAAKRSKRK